MTEHVKHHGLTFVIERDGWAHNTADGEQAVEFLSEKVRALSAASAAALHADLLAAFQEDGLLTNLSDYPAEAERLCMEARDEARKGWARPEDAGFVFLSTRPSPP